MKKLQMQSDFLKDSLTLISGTAFAQALPIIISPVLTRIYSPVDFGIFGLYLGLAAVFSVIATARYEMAIMVPEKEENAVQVLFLSIFFSVTTAFLTLIMVLIFKGKIAELLKNPGLEVWLYFLPLSVLFTGLYQSFNFWLNREKKYQQLATSKVVQGSLTTGTNLGAGLFSSGPFGLVFGRIIGQGGAALYLFFKGIKSLAGFKKALKPGQIVEQAVRHKNFPLYTTWSILFNMGSMQLPFFLLSSYFGGAIVGFYTLSSRVLTMPFSLIGASLGQVYYKNALDDRQNPEKLKEATMKLYLNLLFLGVMPTAVLVGFGDYLFKWVFGAEWIMAGNFTRALGPWILLVFISSPLTGLFNVFEKQKSMLYWDVAVFMLRLLALIIGTVLLKDVVNTIIILAIVSFISRLFLTSYLLNLVGIKYEHSLPFSLFSIASPCFALWILRILLKSLLV